MILTMVAMLSITAAFAEGEKTAEVSNLEAYELNINMNKLSKALGLYDDQKEVVEEIHHTFAAEPEVRSRVWQEGSRRNGEACHFERC